MKKEVIFFAHKAKTPFIVNIILKREDAINEEALRDRKKVEVEGGHFWLINPKPLFIAKLIFARERDIEDVTHILQRGKEIDEPLLFHLVKEYRYEKLKKILQYTTKYDEKGDQYSIVHSTEYWKKPFFARFSLENVNHETLVTLVVFVLFTGLIVSRKSRKYLSENIWKKGVLFAGA